jgi:hypothetical protein
VPALWRFHAVHPSREHRDWLAASRVHPVDPTFIRCCGVLPGFFFGFTKETFGVLLAPDALLAIVNHANVRWRFGRLAGLVANRHFPSAAIPRRYGSDESMAQNHLAQLAAPFRPPNLPAAPPACRARRRDRPAAVVRPAAPGKTHGARPPHFPLPLRNFASCVPTHDRYRPAHSPT